MIMRVKGFELTDARGVVTNLREPLEARGGARCQSARRSCCISDSQRYFTFVRTFSKLGGETSEKQMRKMSVCGYESGRRRLPNEQGRARSALRLPAGFQGMEAQR